ncbi:MAG: hypothetical protein IAB80_02080 [Bacteroidetes bacterium]|uniref:Uncharacterized protein n=1 Tax=Candidatus Cryptobacteroides excrementipullorum TaxID=2840761 RepID=A0A9D9IRF0_9BACT|nr:hypothetical protein [Candidatus Cryptobacteroides excrementipullorum]
MNLRDIKKDIEYIIGEFIDDCMLFVNLNPGKDSDEVAKIIDEAVDLYNDLKDKVNAKVEGNRKAYYNGIRKELFEKTDELCEKLSSAVSK